VVRQRQVVITVKDYNTFLEPVVLEMKPKATGTVSLTKDDVITLSVVSGTLQDSEVLILGFGLDGKQIATNSGNSMKVSKLIEIASKRYKEDLYDKEITLRAFPRDVKDNSDREAAIFKLKLVTQASDVCELVIEK